jgi:hypothetical protein
MDAANILDTPHIRAFYFRLNFLFSTAPYTHTAFSGTSLQLVLLLIPAPSASHAYTGAEADRVP